MPDEPVTPEELSRAMSHLASRRRKRWRKCEGCGIRYEGFGRSRYHSPQCCRRSWIKARRERARSLPANDKDNG